MAHNVGLTDDTIDMQAAGMQLQEGGQGLAEVSSWQKQMTQYFWVQQDASRVGLDVLDSMLGYTFTPVYRCTEAGEPDFNFTF